MEYQENTVAANVSITATPANDNSDLNTEINIKDIDAELFLLVTWSKLSGHWWCSSTPTSPQTLWPGSALGHTSSRPQCVPTPSHWSFLTPPLPSGSSSREWPRPPATGLCPPRPAKLSTRELFSQTKFAPNLPWWWWQLVVSAPDADTVHWARYTGYHSWSLPVPFCVCSPCNGTV